MASSDLSSFAVASVLKSGMNALNAELLKPLDDVLRCQICCEYFKNCMITKCNHNYCSICIRRYMGYRSQCPICFQVATEPELRNNRLIDEVLQIYIKIRENLCIPTESTDISIPKPCSSSTKTTTTENLSENEKAGTSNNTSSKQQNEDTASDEVPCPVCSITVPKSRINIHLDICLKQSEERSQRKFLPKLVYHLMTDKEIRKKLKEHGLSTSGDRQVMIRRHKNYITLHNANCDSLNPKPEEDLLQEIERQEVEERLNAAPKDRYLYEGSDPLDIKNDYENYMFAHRSQFTALIQDVQERALGRGIKQEINSSEVTTSNITDESGNVIGETIFNVKHVPFVESASDEIELSDSSFDDEDTVIIKEKPSESLEDYKLKQEILRSSVYYNKRDIGMEYMDTDADPVLIKEEPSESLHEEYNQKQDPFIKSSVYDNKPDTGMEYMDTDAEPVIIKQELSESLHEGTDPVIMKEESSESLNEEYNKKQDLIVKSPVHKPDIGSTKFLQLPYRIKKILPTMKIKEEPQSVLDSVSNQQHTAANPNSVDDFETSKKQSKKHHKKKNARRLSAEEMNSQRKK